MTNAKAEKAQAKEFQGILAVIQHGRTRALAAVNVALIETYAAIGAILSRKVREGGWGKGVIRELADWLQAKAPDFNLDPAIGPGALVAISFAPGLFASLPRTLQVRRRSDEMPRHQTIWRPSHPSLSRDLG